MKPFDYVSVLLSFVVSLVIAQVLVGISHLIQSGVKRVSTPLVYWIAYVLFNCVDYWFSIWGLHDHQGWSFWYVSFLLMFAASLFLTARAVVPDGPAPEPIDLRDFYNRNRRRIMALFLFYAILGTIANLTLPGFTSSELFGIALGLIALFAIGWWSAKDLVQWVVVALNLALTTYYAIRYEPLL